MSYKYNQLLKLNLQKVDNNGGGGDDTPKVTKFFSATDTLEDGEAAEYQGADDAANGLIYGYFYKKNDEQPYSAHCCRLYEQVTALNVTYSAGDYIFDRTEDYGSNINLVSITVTGNVGYKYITIGNNSDIAVGTIIYKSTQTETFNAYATVTSISGSTYYLDDNTSFEVISKSVRGGSDIHYYKKDNIEIAMLQDEYWSPVAALGFYNSAPYPIIFMPWQPGTFYNPGMIGVYTNVTVTPPPFKRVDTQPRTPGVTVADGVLQISLPVEFSGNITVHGSEVVVTTEQIQSEKDFIKLRYNNPLALASGETSGISVNNYDGNDTDCILAVDKDGWARVGDSSGTLEKIATIEESPLNGAFVAYNAVNKQLESKTSIAQFSVSWSDLGIETSGFTAAFIDALLNYIHTNFSNKQFVGLVKPNNVRTAFGNCYEQNNKYYTTMLIMGVDGSLCLLHESANVWTVDDITKTAHPF